MENTKPIVLLYSGGFDSTILLHNLRSQLPSTEIHCIHFDYGQPNKAQEAKCVHKNCEKLNCKEVYITLPPFDWTTSEFYKKGFESHDKQEVEFRNLVFLSYAISYAKSIGSDSVYTATLRSGGYADTSKEFFTGLNNFLKGVSDIEVHTPFEDCTKDNLACFAFFHDIGPHDFFTCDTPVKGKPCGKCPDCVNIREIMDFIRVKTPFQQFCKVHGDTEDHKFKELFYKSRITEARLYTNNTCQLKCSHCYYGFDDMHSEPLSVEEYKRVIDECVMQGVLNFHFSGKEPLMDDSLFEYAAHIKEHYSHVTYDLVTNGLLLFSKASKLKEAGFSRVCVSLDDIKPGDYRDYDKTSVLKGIEECNHVGLPVTVFLDLSYGNYSSIDHIIKYLYEKLQVKDFYVRAIRYIGNAEDKEEMTIDQLKLVYDLLYEFAEVNPEVTITFDVPHSFVSDVMNSEKDNTFCNAVLDVFDFSYPYFLPNFILSPEFYCSRYENQITITPDGYVLGCTSETSAPNYHEVSVGSVREKSIKELIAEGKKVGIRANHCLDCRNFKECTF